MLANLGTKRARFAGSRIGKDCRVISKASGLIAKEVTIVFHDIRSKAHFAFRKMDLVLTLIVEERMHR